MRVRVQRGVARLGPGPHAYAPPCCIPNALYGTALPAPFTTGCLGLHVVSSLVPAHGAGKEPPSADVQAPAAPPLSAAAAEGMRVLRSAAPGAASAQSDEAVKAALAKAAAGARRRREDDAQEAAAAYESEGEEGGRVQAVVRTVKRQCMVFASDSEEGDSGAA